MSLLSYLFAFSWVLLCFLKIIILNSFSINSQIVFSLQSITEKLLFLWWGHVSLLFCACVCDGFELMSMHLRDQPYFPVFKMDFVGEKMYVRELARWGITSLISVLPQHHMSMHLHQLTLMLAENIDYSAFLWTRMVKSCVWQRWPRLFSSPKAGSVGLLLFLFRLWRNF